MVEFYNGDRSSRYPNDSDMVFDGIPFINAGDLVLGRVKLDTTNKITEEKYNQLSGAKIQCGDIIYCLRGTLGKNAFVDNFDIGTIASSLVDIRPQKIVGKYLFQVLNSDIEYSQRILNDEGAAQPNLSAKNLYLFDIPIPRDAEQIKIAEYLELLDHLITLHQSKSFGHILKVIISCTLSWEQRKLGEVCNIITKQTGFDYSSTIKPALLKEKADNTYPFIQNKDFNGTTINMDTDFFIPISVAEKFPNIVLDRPSILISISGRIGNVGFYSCVHKAFIGGAVGICKLKYNDDGKFIIHELESEYGQKYFYSLIKASSHANITVEDIRNMELIFPEKKEEKICISTFFSSFNHLITLHQLEPFQLIFKAIAYRIIDYTKSKPPSHRK